MGADGHTASLFPDTAALQEKKLWVVANRIEALNTHRITFTYPLINRAARILILVTGADKAERIVSLFGPDAQPDAFPVQAVNPSEGVVEWYLDEPAAAGLAEKTVAEPAAA